ncbi:ras-related protein Rab-37-like [Physella acuta]|uniref:ras-related protein Rab-37-like n=1 Tax=Physella acuta TaxID=109671 RepID=UPI0027DADE68|nr:ras-related protein Rab-37-like [Physella acuta]
MYVECSVKNDANVDLVFTSLASKFADRVPVQQEEPVRLESETFYQVPCFVFDLSIKSSFDNIQRWLNQVHEYAGENVDIVLVGNKVDLAESRAIDHETASSLAQTIGAMYVECSAKTGGQRRPGVYIAGKQRDNSQCKLCYRCHVLASSCCLVQADDTVLRT